MRQKVHSVQLNLVMKFFLPNFTSETLHQLSENYEIVPGSRVTLTK